MKKFLKKDKKILLYHLTHQQFHLRSSEKLKEEDKKDFCITHFLIQLDIWGYLK